MLVSSSTVATRKLVVCFCDPAMPACCTTFPHRRILGSNELPQRVDRRRFDWNLSILADECFGVGQRRKDSNLGIELVDDVARRSGRSKQHEPGNCVDAGQTDFGRGGKSGSTATRALDETPSARTLPSRINGTPEGSENMSGTWPATTSVIAGTLPLWAHGSSRYSFRSSAIRKQMMWRAGARRRRRTAISSWHRRRGRHRFHRQVRMHHSMNGLLAK